MDAITAIKLLILDLDAAWRALSRSAEWTQDLEIRMDAIAIEIDRLYDLLP